MVSGEFGKINPINELMNMKPTPPITSEISLGALFQQTAFDWSFDCQPVIIFSFSFPWFIHFPNIIETASMRDSALRATEFLLIWNISCSCPPDRALYREIVHSPAGCRVCCVWEKWRGGFVHLSWVPVSPWQIRYQQSRDREKYAHVPTPITSKHNWERKEKMAAAESEARQYSDSGNDPYDLVGAMRDVWTYLF